MKLWRQIPLTVRLLLIFAIAGWLLYAGIWEGKAGDCQPGNRDGQCGLSTSAGFAGGILVGGIVLIIGWAATIVDWFRQRRSKKAKG